MTRRFLYGFLALYTAGLLLSGIRLHVLTMATREWCWASDFTVQLAVCAYWIRTLWRSQ